MNPPCTQMPNAKNGSEDAGGRVKRGKREKEEKRGEREGDLPCVQQEKRRRRLGSIDSVAVKS